MNISDGGTSALKSAHPNSGSKDAQNNNNQAQYDQAGGSPFKANHNVQNAAPFRSGMTPGQKGPSMENDESTMLLVNPAKQNPFYSGNDSMDKHE